MHERIAPASPRRAARGVQKGIPADKGDRDRLRGRVAEYARREGLTPPMSFDELISHTDRFVASGGLPKAWRKYAAVLLHNETWRDVLARTPYRRRLLLLPQCLRDPHQCPGEVDELGLLCRRCGRCPIGRLQAEAERLGYVVLVAEGTTVVTSLIASGKVEAVVGASCLSVLERMFSYVSGAAVPALAVPLLRDGCADTRVDLDWVWDALYLTADDATRRLDLEALRDEVRSWFSPAALEETLGAPDGQTEQIARDWLAVGGKRWRPFLAACAFQALRDDPERPLSAELRRVAVAVECFHKASLVHDDIEDADEERYGRKTLHAAHGVPVALNVGDFLLGEGYRLLADGPPGRPRAEMLRVAALGHRKLTVGQGAELCWRRHPRPLATEEVLDIFRQKTAPAFEVALRLGALCAGADGAVGEVLSRYSDRLGVAYQIRDDLTDFLPAGDGAEGAATTGDARAMRPSLLLALAYERATGRRRDLLADVWAGRVSLGAPDEAEKVASVVAELRIESAALALLRSHEQQAATALGGLQSVGLKCLLRRVIHKIFSDVEGTDWCREHQAGHAGRRSGRDARRDSAA